MTEKFDRQEVRGDVPNGGLRMKKTPSTRELSLSQHPTLLRGCDKRNIAGHDVQKHLDTHYGDNTTNDQEHLLDSAIHRGGTV